MTNCDPDLHHAISLRPSPFHANPDRIPGNSFIPVLGPSVEAGRVATPNQIVSSNIHEAFEARQRPGYQRNSSDSERDAADVERGQSLPDYASASDPYSLRQGMKTDEQIQTMKANTGRKRRSGTCGVVAHPKETMRARKLGGFYEQQNENIERLLKPVDEHVSTLRSPTGASNELSGACPLHSYAQNYQHRG